MKKNSQMLATAIMGSTVGRKKAVRSRPRAGALPSTSSAMASASPTDSGTVPAA